MEAIVTRHAEKRVRKRLGLNKSAVQRTVQAALDHGKTPSDYQGQFKRYLDGLYLDQKTANNIRVKDGIIYLFDNEVLITAYHAPNKFRNHAQ